jgi:CHAT domain-containing protein
MSDARPSVERLLGYLEAALAQSSLDRAQLSRVEAAFAALYALVAGEREELEALGARWPAAAERHRELEAWRLLVHWAAALGQEGSGDTATLEASLARAPRWTALLVGAEAARLIWNTPGGADRAWSQLQRAGTLDLFEALSRPTEQQSENPMFAECCCVLLELSASKGDWKRFAGIESHTRRIWREDHPAAIKVGLVRAGANVARGEYQAALDWIARWQNQMSDQERIVALATKLHALVARGSASDEAAGAALQAFLDLERRLAESPLLATSTHRKLRESVEQIARTSRVLSDVLEDAASDDPSVHRGAGTGNRELFEAEALARRNQHPERRKRALAELLSRVEEAIEGDGAKTPDELLRLRLLWCRLVVDDDQAHAFDECERVLSTVITEAARLGARPLEMLALDQRGLLRARFEPPDLRGAMEDGIAATALATELLNANSSTSDDGKGRRAFLESLLPVFDRVIEVHAIAASRVGQHLGGKVVDPFDPTLFDSRTPGGEWQRLGRVLHGYSEQAQALALADARRAREYSSDQVESLSSIDPRAAEVLDAFRGRLRPTDAVLQYSLVGSYLLIFAYGRGFFDWRLQTVHDQASSERAVESLVRDLRDWTQGEEPSSMEALRRLHELVLPDQLGSTLDRARATHLFIVPHGALYRVPFGRLALPSGPLGLRFSLSLHPTGLLAAESASAPPQRLGRRATLAHVVGPEQGVTAEVQCAPAERAALTGALGRFWPPAAVRPLEGWRQSLASILAALGGYELLHFTCHGQEGSALGQRASMLVATGNGGLDSRAISKLELTSCALVVLQSCWTGWMDHKRSNPVQGIPQAFCDAGVGAVIAPLTQVPMALAATFSSIFYRALRFLPAEVALQRTLHLLRRYGSVVVAGDPAASEAFVACGSSLDRLEYRYTGAAGIRLGSRFSRAIGRVVFWWFERSLARRARGKEIGDAARGGHRHRSLPGRSDPESELRGV